MLPVVNWCPVEPAAPGRVRQRDVLRLRSRPGGGGGAGGALRRARRGDGRRRVRARGVEQAVRQRGIGDHARWPAARPRSSPSTRRPRGGRALAGECAAVARAEGAAVRARRRRDHRLARARCRPMPARRSSPTASPAAPWNGKPATGRSAGWAAPRHGHPGGGHGLRAAARRQRRRRLSVRPRHLRTYVRALGQSHDRGRGGRCAARLPRRRRSCATSTPPRRSTPASTRSGPSPRSTACPSARGCRSAGRSTRTGDALMPASTASWAIRRS